LSIDSGGIRGIIPAVALVKLENTTGKLTRETFSFVAGTSTGAIIAAAIAAGVPATRILDFYLNRTKEIFDGSLLKYAKMVLFGSRYPTQKLHDLIAEAVGPARSWTLNDSPIDILLTAKRISDGMPWYFVRDNPRNSGCMGRLGIVDCATASAAAPTYFQPWQIAEVSTPPQCETVGMLVDGAVGVTGNPVYQACIEAFDYTPGYTPAETLTVSLGTGRFKKRKQPGWIGAWLEWVLAELLDSPGEQQTEITQRHFPQMPFYRIDLELEENIGLDDSRKIDRVLEYGEKLAELIDWEAILAGTEAMFRIGPANSLWEQYKVHV
ncbi:MAG TPA: patatin-like phospholipase family protein, partial [Anaerolineales bacterium]|nr:patatin-like phospholipase family protein [Anaerolineales bacterium]